MVLTRYFLCFTLCRQTIRKSAVPEIFRPNTIRNSKSLSFPFLMHLMFELQQVDLTLHASIRLSFSWVSSLWLSNWISVLTKGWIGVPKVASECTYNHRLLYFDHNCLQNTFLLQELNQLRPVHSNWPKETPHLSRLDMTPSFNRLWCCIYCPQSKDGEGISKWSTWR